MSGGHHERRYPHDYNGPLFDWPGYRPVKETPEQIDHARMEYAALLSMCDAHLGKVLDAMDRHDLWKDTMLVVWTDHGFLLAERGCWAKNWMPLYEEVAHTPFFVWDPRHAKQGEHRASLAQPAIDLAPTLLDFFDIEIPPDMLGKSLAATIATDSPVREAAIFGYHGQAINITDGRHVYLRVPPGENRPLNSYTLTPTMLRGPDRIDTLRSAEMALPFGFSKGCPMLRLPAVGADGASTVRTLLFDLEADPRQERPIEDPQLEARLVAQMCALMRECDAPPEQFERMDLDRIFSQDKDDVSGSRLVGDWAVKEDGLRSSDLRNTFFDSQCKYL